MNAKSFICFFLIAVLSPAYEGFAQVSDQAERFKDTEIRVIRPRYFNKSQRFELGGQLSTIMNETFIYTFMATGLASFHFSEEWAIEGSVSYGFSLDKEDKRVLFDEFDIKTQIFRTLYNTEIAFQYTPIYGKWQLASGKLVYFDTFFTFGAGTTGIDWRYSDFCDDVIENNVVSEPVRSNQVKSYPTGMLGVGQRYFVSRSVSYRFDFRVHRFYYNTLDTECNVDQVRVDGDFISNAPHDIITLQLGTSYYF